MDKKSFRVSIIGAIALAFMAAGSCNLAKQSAKIVGARFFAESHLKAKPSQETEFNRLLKQDLESYFRQQVRLEVTADYELLRQGPTQSGASYPKYYAWVIVRDKTSRLKLEEGAVRIAALEKTRFEVTDYLSRSEINEDINSAYSLFPKAVCERIKEKLATKQKEDSLKTAREPKLVFNPRVDPSMFGLGVFPDVGKDGTIFATLSATSAGEPSVLYALDRGGAKKWTFKMNGTIESLAVGRDGSVCLIVVDYEADLSKSVIALTPSGKEKWAVKIDDPSSYVKISIGDNGSVYVISQANGRPLSTLKILNAKGGLQKKISVDSYIASWAFGTDGSIYLRDEGVLSRMDANGTRIWTIKHAEAHSVFQPPMVVDTIYLQVGEDDPASALPTDWLYAYSTDGALKWKFRIDGQIWYLTQKEDAILFYTNSETLYALSSSGTKRWEYRIKGMSSAPETGKNGNTYFFNHDETGGASLNLLTPAGKKAWSMRAGDSALTETIGLDGIVYFVKNNRIYTVDPQ